MYWGSHSIPLKTYLLQSQPINLLTHVIAENGDLRIFNRLRYNQNCQLRNSSCRVFEQFQQPQPIPDDLYVKLDFENDLDWVITSQENTGTMHR